MQWHSLHQWLRKFPLAAAVLDVAARALSATERLAELISPSLTKLFSGLALALDLFFPIAIGGIITLYQIDHQPGEHWYSLRLLGKYWYLIAYLLAWAGNRFYLSYARRILRDRSIAYNELKHLYRALNIDDNSTLSVRCTLWIPSKRIHKRVARLVQWTDYMPQSSKINTKSGTRYHENGRAGRTYKLYHGTQVKRPVGPLGACCFKEDVKGSWSRLDTIPVGKSLRDYLVNDHNFLTRHADCVMQDRVETLVLCLVSDGKVQGLVYIDSNTRNFFSKQIVKMIESHGPRILESIRA